MIMDRILMTFKNCYQSVLHVIIFFSYIYMCIHFYYCVLKIVIKIKSSISYLYYTALQHLSKNNVVCIVVPISIVQRLYLYFHSGHGRKLHTIGHV